ncbi:unnamed protein product [Phaeothamnion confervicola]
MTQDRIFFGYMVLFGVAAGAFLATVAGADGFWLKPFFWILIAVGLFDGGSFLLGRMLTPNGRMIGFLIGAALTFAIPAAMGKSVSFF